jgi:hypothetical protein
MTESLDRIDELLLSEATDSLSEAEQTELHTLLAAHESIDRYAYIRAASTFFLAVGADPSERMPQALSTRLRLDAADFSAQEDK